MNKRLQARLAGIAAFGLPLGLVWVIGNALGSVEPASAGEAVTPDPNQAAALQPADMLPPTPAGARERRARELRATPLGVSPFYVPPPSEEPVEDVVSEPAPQLSIQGIMTMRSGLVALVNGKRLQVGDRVHEDSSWEVMAIDAETRSLQLRNVLTGESRRYGR